MDLEQFRKTYMMSEGIGNTPIRGFQRTVDLVGSVAGIPKAVKRDRIEKNKKFHAREEAINDIKENGISSDALIQLFTNRRTLGNHTIDAVEKAADAATAVALSVNELGQTASAIVGTNNTNLYGGQDMENGIRFVLRAKNITSKGLRLPGRMLRKIDGLLVGEGFDEVKRGELRKSANKTHDEFSHVPERDTNISLGPEK